jgi:hypothetical protein
MRFSSAARPAPCPLGSKATARRPAPAGRRLRRPGAQPAQPFARGRRGVHDRRPGHRREYPGRGGRGRDRRALGGRRQGRRGKGAEPGTGSIPGRRGHLVYISVVGADRIPIVSGVDRAMFGWFGSKLLESFRQPVALLHRSHSSVASCHISRPANPGRCDEAIELAGPRWSATNHPAREPDTERST